MVRLNGRGPASFQEAALSVKGLSNQINGADARRGEAARVPRRAKKRLGAAHR